jgi:proline iminopeptidase
MATPKSHRTDPSKYHLANALGEDEDLAKKSAYAHSCLEHGILSLDDRVSDVTFEEFDPSSSKIEMHYIKNYCFVAENYILDHAHKLTMPIWIVQGRYDMVCPPIGAYRLSQKLTNAQLIWTIAGHRASEHESWNVMRTIMLQLVSKK